MLHNREQIEQALKLHKLINKSSTLGSGKKAPLPKKTLAKRPKKGSGDVTTSKTVDQSSKERKASPEKTLASPKVEKCEEHPGESLQFYSLSYNKALCPTCLLSGVYAGTETLSIKKASETLKHKMADLIIEMEGKLDVYELFMKKLANRKEELKDITTGHKKEIAANITQLINKLQNKQKELVAELDQIEKEKLEDLNIASQRIKSHEDQVRAKKNEMENKVRELNGLSLCNFYSKQVYAIQNCLQDEGSIHLQEARIISETNINLQGRVCLDRFKEAIRFNNAEIDRVTIHALEPLIEQAKSSARARSPVKEHISDKELAYSHRKTRELGGGGFAGSPLKHGGLASGSKGTTIGISSRGYSGARSNLNLRERKQDIDDILNSGYQRIQEMKAMSSMYSMPLTSKSRKREDIFGLSDLLSSSTSKRPISTKGTHHPGYSNSDTKFQTLFSEPRVSGKENTQFSHKGTPHKGFDLDRYSINAKLL